jgi:hypothetical protein
MRCSYDDDDDDGGDDDDDYDDDDDDVVELSSSFCATYRLTPRCHDVSPFTITRTDRLSY